MVYKVRKSRGKNEYKIFNTDTGVIHSNHTAKANANAQLQLLHQIKGNGLTTEIARKLYDWWKPPISFEEWKERSQTRFKTDAEAEAQLANAKADKQLIKMEDKLLKLRKDTEGAKLQVEQIRKRKIDLANNIGVYMGDVDNPIRWEEAKASNSKADNELKRIKEEDPDYVGVGIFGGKLPVSDIQALLKQSYADVLGRLDPNLLVGKGVKSFYSIHILTK